VPKISVIVRKAYGAGLYAMAGPAFEPDCCTRAADRLDRRDGPAGRDQRRLLQPAAGDRGRDQRAADRGAAREYAQDIDILHLASELVIDAVVEPEDLRSELVRRFALAAGKRRDWPAKRNPVTPV
jgi:acetyl-CoA carboxylase carboxyltransferase component